MANDPLSGKHLKNPKKKKKKKNRSYMLMEQAMCVCVRVRVHEFWGVQCLWELWTMTSVCYCWLWGVVDYFEYWSVNLLTRKKKSPDILFYDYVHHYPETRRVSEHDRDVVQVIENLPVVDISESAKRLTSMFNLLSIWRHCVLKVNLSTSGIIIHTGVLIWGFTFLNVMEVL